MAAMRSLGSPVAKSMKRAWVEEVRRKPLRSILLLVASAAFGYHRCESNEDQELRKRLGDYKRECRIIQDRYQRQLENVNAELMKLAREAVEK